MNKLALSFIALNALDIGLTLLMVGSGQAYELNPIMAHVLSWPVYFILLFKIALPMAFMFGLIFIGSRINMIEQTKRILIALVAIESAICLFNLGGMLYA